MSKDISSNLNINSVAIEFSVSRATVWRWRRDGKLPEPDFVIGEHPYWNRDSLYQRLRAQASRASHDNLRTRTPQTSNDQNGGEL
jgi:hypothetical protein